MSTEATTESEENQTQEPEQKEIIQDYFPQENTQLSSQQEILSHMLVFNVQQHEIPQDFEKKSILELTTGFEKTYIPTLELIKAQLDLISKAQKELITNTQIVTNEMNTIPNYQEISIILDQLPMYIQKTKQISKKMKSIDEKAHMLKQKTEKTKISLKK